MRQYFMALTLIYLCGCANNPVSNSQLLAKTSLYDPLFLASTVGIPDKVEFKSLAIMYQNKIPAFYTPMEHIVITEKGVFFSEWQSSTYEFKHKLMLSFAEIDSVSNTVIEKDLLPNSEYLEIKTKSGSIHKFWLLDKGSNFAKSLILRRLTNS